uniref:Uncharacterized protein n=1 Tax=Tanacetum cinerariifolium TaxID=118510 RepID=A0A699TWV5_TANCI|nr:hypothetical protein [Tanacetum cinerariifolium]
MHDDFGTDEKASTLIPFPPYGKQAADIDQNAQGIGDPHDGDIHNQEQPEEQHMNGKGYLHDRDDVLPVLGGGVSNDLKTVIGGKGVHRGDSQERLGSVLTDIL